MADVPLYAPHVGEKPSAWARWWLSVITAIFAISLIAAAGWFWGSGTRNAWGETPCDDRETRELRFLVQLFNRQRTDAEFALARAETERQRLEGRVRALEDAIRAAAERK